MTAVMMRGAAAAGERVESLAEREGVSERISPRSGWATRAVPVLGA